MIANFEAMPFGSRDRVRYVPTYYPGTPIATEAQRITVGPGQEVSSIVIALARAATATVHGVVHSSGQPLSPLTLVIAREIGGAQASGRMADAVAASDGSFGIAGLLPGTYMVEARTLEPGSMAESQFASTEVVVEGSDVTGVSLTLSAGTTARGRVRFDTGKPPEGLRPSEVFVMPTFVDRQSGGMQMRGGPPVLRDDWTFEVRGLRGRGFISAGIMGDWEMKRVQREGVDVTDSPLDFSTDIDGIEIELTQQVTKVSGGVSDDKNSVAFDATVIVFADDPAKWGPHSRYINSARPDQQGRFTIHGLPPGKYVAIAVGYLEPGEERDPDLLQEWQPRGTSFTLSEGETHTLDLKLSGS
jgi:hypothetical protein